ncbi:MAG: site-specific integrase [Hyphomicrobiaceae bacterium]|nr:site-specific integrase [Hyphomicrobiaceae bacterium]
MSRGTIISRGEESWRLKFDLPNDGGPRKTRYVTFRGTKGAAQKELTRLLSQMDGGTFIEPSKLTVTAYLRKWVEGADIEPKTRERYSQLIEQQVVPHLGAILLQRLRPETIKEWHKTLLAKGGKDGAPLSPRTVGHAHRCLRTALQAAVAVETLVRNSAAAIRPPKIEEVEVEILDAAAVPTVLEKLKGHALEAIGTTALASGARRRELLAVSWPCIDLDGASIRIERSLEQTKDGLRFKSPKTKNGTRTISLPATAVTALREHKVRQMRLHMQLGLGKLEDDALVFSRFDGKAFVPIEPNNLSRDWTRAVKALRLPKVSFHALRHTHASALIGAGLDVVAVSKRLGHGSVTTTLKTYAHLFAKRQKDEAAAVSIDAIMRG